MSNTLFIQFYSRSKTAYFDLTNGFSDTYDLCRQKGDFIWIDHEGDSSKWDRESIYTSRTLPIDKGTVYISAAYINHLYQAYIWASLYPKIQFIVGGPVAASRNCHPNEWSPLYFQVRKNVRIPENLQITNQSVENLFNVANFSGQWQLPVPMANTSQNGIDRDSPIYFSYTLDNGCYWGKCIYCNIKEAPVESYRTRKIIHFPYADMDHSGKKIVRLNTGSITPKKIASLLPKLPRRDDLFYRTFMRSAPAENRALKEALTTIGDHFPALTLGLGIEFPSDRMLAYMGKGITQEDILDTLHICAAYQVKVNGNVILGWDNLIEKDLLDLEQFFKRMPDKSMTTAQLRWLYAHPQTEIHDRYTGIPNHLGPFYLGFKTEIPPEKTELNHKAVEIIKKYSREKQFKLEGLGNIEMK